MTRFNQTVTHAGDGADEAGFVASSRALLAAVDAREVLALHPVDPERYDVRGEVACGGMGKVLRAFDRWHRRDVAIKMVLGHGEVAMRRFVREAAITARLQHPSIVPVHEAGRWMTGEPYFAMKLIEGQALDAVAAQATSLRERLALLPHLVATIDALAYAHARGIIHRDLKPANVLVGHYGETVVIDWGLAKDLRAGEGASGRPSGACDECDQPARLSVDGRALGTPSYMPPEQARGGEVDARADVYALGALMYHVLAGGPPYEGATTRETLEQVLAAPPIPLARRAPEVPADLSAIVDKAMARDAGDRYASAEAMAADLRRFATGRLVSVHDYSLLQLFQRFVARHRAAVTVAAALLTTLAVVVAAAVHRITRERDRADVLKIEADRQRVSAVAQRDAAESLVAFVLGDLRSGLEPIGRLDVLRGVGSHVLAYYRDSASVTDVRDEQSLARRSEATGLVGRVDEDLHDAEGARRAYEESIVVAERARLLAPDDPDVRGRLAEAHLRLCGLETASSRLDAADAQLKIATQLIDAVVIDAPRVARWHQVKGGTRTRGAWILEQRGDIDGAYAAAVAAKDELTLASELDPGSIDATRELAWAFSSLGDLSMQRGDLDAAVREYQRALARREQIAVDPRDAQAAFDRAWSYESLGTAESERGELDAAMGHLRTGLEIRRALAQRDPANEEWRRLLGLVLSKICQTHLRKGTLGPAGAECDEALTTVDAVAGRHQGRASSARDLVHALRNSGRLALLQRDVALATVRFERALQTAEQQLASAPGSSIDGQLVARSLSWLARADLEGKRIGPASDHIRRALSLLEDLTARAPGDAEGREELANSRSVAGDVELARGDARAALALYRAAEADFTTLVAKHPTPALAAELARAGAGIACAHAAKRSCPAAR